MPLKPDYVEAFYNRGNAFREKKRLDEAIANYDKAIALRPDYMDACYNRANALRELKRLDEAVAGYDKVIALKPDCAEAYSDRAMVLYDLRHFDEAIASVDKAIVLRPDLPEAHNTRGVALQNLGFLEKAVASYDRAIASWPDYADAYNNRGEALRDLQRHEEALASFAMTIELVPQWEFVLGNYVTTKMMVCDWSTWNEDAPRFLDRLERHEKVSMPFPVIAISNSREMLRKTASVWAADKHPVDNSLPALVRRPKREKIRVGYFSADFHGHATAFLMAELFERHDRSRFEVIGFSFGIHADDGMRKRLEAAFDRFIDVRNRPDREVALLARELGIDIAVDLKGFTQGSRANIFAHRAAPVQVNYLGYPGTMAAEYMDYLIGDPVVIPAAHRADYTEKIVRLPDSYQPNDTKRRISERVFRRAELGLPETGFVYCCFNNNYKITPDVFDLWMRILGAVPGSVLWLLQDNATAAANLRREAERRGVPGDRLVFAPRMVLAEHLSRHSLADLFLDTLPCNAHTTASDALWAGLPVLTRVGETFAGRVAASLLGAIGLPELIVETPEAYVDLAIGLAGDPARLAGLRQRLEKNRLTTPLFDIAGFTRHIEAAYTAMYERYQAGLPADHIDIARER